MMPNRLRVSQTQIEKVIKAARRSGVEVRTIEIRQDGTVALSSELTTTHEDQLDSELAKWRAKRAS